MRLRLFSAMMAIGAIALIPVLTGAQQSSAPATENSAHAPKDSKETPRGADGKPDLTGSWRGGNGGDNNVRRNPDGSVRLVLPTAAAAPLSEDPDEKQAFANRDKVTIARRKSDPNQPPYKPELLAKVEQLDENETKLDPSFFCRPEGIPRLGPPAQIAQAPGLLVFLYDTEKGNTFREIPTDGRPHDKINTGTYYGDSVGRWDGDALVVDAVGFTDDTWLGIDGWFHSTALHVVERFTREGDSLRYEATVEDPNVFTRPWVLNPRTLRLSHEIIVENPPCVEKDEGHIVGHQHH